MKLAAAFAIAAPLAGAAEIVPAEPHEFDAVNLRIAADSCSFVPATVRVQAVANTFRVTQQPNACLAPGPVKVFDIRLGTLPTGRYAVELYAMPTATGTPVERIAFEVAGRPEIAIFPPPPRPLTDYSGMWWNAAESGWGLSLHQSPTNVVFGVLFVYDAANQPDWYALPHGRWIDATTWASDVFRTAGPYVGLGQFDPSLVTFSPVGAATLDFSQNPGEEGRARFTYTIGGVTRAKVITRMPF